MAGGRGSLAPRARRRAAAAVRVTATGRWQFAQQKVALPNKVDSSLDNNLTHVDNRVYPLVCHEQHQHNGTLINACFS